MVAIQNIRTKALDIALDPTQRPTAQSTVAAGLAFNLWFLLAKCWDRGIVRVCFNSSGGCGVTARGHFVPLP